MKLLLIPFLFSLFSAKAFTDPNPGPILDKYHGIQTALAQDAFPEAANLAGEAISSLQYWLDQSPKEHAQRPDVEKMLEGANALANGTKEAELRVAFGTYSQGMVGFLQKDIRLRDGYQLFFCPMVTTFAYWVQPRGEKIANPYMGTSMPTCGSKRPW